MERLNKAMIPCTLLIMYSTFFTQLIFTHCYWFYWRIVFPCSVRSFIFLIILIWWNGRNGFFLFIIMSNNADYVVFLWLIILCLFWVFFFADQRKKVSKSKLWLFVIPHPHSAIWRNKTSLSNMINLNFIIKFQILPAFTII